jgi:hypothetical protein
MIVCNPAEKVRGEGSACPGQYNSSTTMSELISKLFCSYDPYVRPVRQYSDTVDVKMQLVLKKIEFVSTIHSSYISAESN